MHTLFLHSCKSSYSTRDSTVNLPFTQLIVLTVLIGSITSQITMASSSQPASLPPTTAQKNGIVASSRVHPQLDADEQAKSDELIAKQMAALNVCSMRYIDPGNYMPAKQYLYHHGRNKAAKTDGQQATAIDVYKSKCPNSFDEPPYSSSLQRLLLRAQLPRSKCLRTRFWQA